MPNNPTEQLKALEARAKALARGDKKSADMWAKRAKALTLDTPTDRQIPKARLYIDDDEAQQHEQKGGAHDVNRPDRVRRGKKRGIRKAAT